MKKYLISLTLIFIFFILITTAQDTAEDNWNNKTKIQQFLSNIFGKGPSRPLTRKSPEYVYFDKLYKKIPKGNYYSVNSCIEKFKKTKEDFIFDKNSSVYFDFIYSKNKNVCLIVFLERSVVLWGDNDIDKPTNRFDLINIYDTDTNKSIYFKEEKYNKTFLDENNVEVKKTLKITDILNNNFDCTGKNIFNKNLLLKEENKGWYDENKEYKEKKQKILNNNYPLLNPPCLDVRSNKPVFIPKYIEYFDNGIGNYDYEKFKEYIKEKEK